MEKNPGMRASSMAVAFLLENLNGDWTLSGAPHLSQNISPGLVSEPQRGHVPCADDESSLKTYAFDLRQPHTWQKSESSGICDPHSGQTYLIWLLRPCS